MYELFLLGKLLDRPWYGYEFQQALSGFLGPHRRVSWGTIYPLFQRLERDGLIRAASQRSSKGGRDKQAYTVTPAGKRRFFKLMDTEKVQDPNFREIFRIKLGHFTRVAPEIRKKIVKNYLERVAAVQAHIRKMQEVVRRIPWMSEDERKMVLSAISLEETMAQAEMAWIHKEMSGLVKAT